MNKDRRRTCVCGCLPLLCLITALHIMLLLQRLSTSPPTVKRMNITRGIWSIHTVRRQTSLRCMFHAVTTHLNCPLCGMCSYVAALGCSMMATVMTVNPLGNDLSSCLHSSCTAPPCPGGQAAVASILHAS